MNSNGAREDKKKLESERKCIGMTDSFLKLNFPCNKIDVLHLICGSLQEMPLNIELSRNEPIRSTDTNM